MDSVLRRTLTYSHRHTGERLPLAVLAHQYPATRESFTPLCTDLHELGYATLAFDLRGHGASIWGHAGPTIIDTPAGPAGQDFVSAFVSSITKVGFAHISDDIVRVASWGLAQSFIEPGHLVLVGASVGGTGVLLAAPRLRDALRGVITFGAAGAPAHGSDAMARIPATCEALPVPMLLSTSEGDAFEGANNARTWGSGLAHVTTRIVPGNAHAMAIYYDVRDQVRSFVTALG